MQACKPQFIQIGVYDQVIDGKFGEIIAIVDSLPILKHYYYPQNIIHVSIQILTHYFSISPISCYRDLRTGWATQVEDQLFRDEYTFNRVIKYKVKLINMDF